MGSTWLQNGAAWLETDFLPNLVSFRLVVTGRRDSLARMLATSTLKWERAQQLKQLRGGTRDFKVLLRYQHWYSEPAMQCYEALATDGSKWRALPAGARTSNQRCLIFRLLARSAATCYELLILPEATFPFKLFTLLEKQSTAEMMESAGVIAASPRCEVDDYTISFVARYPTPESMCSTPARAVMVAMALMFEMRTGRLEAKHSRIRRLCKLLSLQTHAPDVMSVTASFVRIAICQLKEAMGVNEDDEIEGCNGKSGKRKTCKVSVWQVFFRPLANSVLVKKQVARRLNRQTSTGRCPSRRSRSTPARPW